MRRALLLLGEDRKILFLAPDTSYVQAPAIVQIVPYDLKKRYQQSFGVQTVYDLKIK